MSISDCFRPCPEPRSRTRKANGCAVPQRRQRKSARSARAHSSISLHGLAIPKTLPRNDNREAFGPPARAQARIVNRMSALLQGAISGTAGPHVAISREQRDLLMRATETSYLNECYGGRPT